MTKWQRIRSFLGGLLTLPICVLVCVNSEIGFLVATSILSISLFCYGIRYLFFYVFMARHMVGGKTLLYIGLIVLDLGLFTMTLTDIPPVYLMLYLFGTHAFGGVIDIMRGMEARKLESPSWKFKIGQGSFNLAVSLLCVIFIRQIEILTWLYSFGLLSHAVMRMYTAFRRTEIAYIQ